MIEKNPTPQPDQFQEGFRKFMRSHTARFLIIGLITLILLIPLFQVKLLIRERGYRQRIVENQISKEWGGSVEYSGIVLKIPIADRSKDDPKKIIESSSFLYILPETTNDLISTTVSEKHRSIFKVNIFSAQIISKVKFDVSKIDSVLKQKLIWEKAQISMITNSETDFKEISAFKIDDRLIEIEGQTVQQAYPKYLETASVPFTINPERNIPINIEFNARINGTVEFKYFPFAKQSQGEMRSNWKNPSFIGNNLPDPKSSKTTDKGFVSTWNNIDMTSGSRNYTSNLKLLHPKKSGVRFIDVVDQYSLNDRTVKYGALVFILTFAVFFLIQIVGKINIHPVHYLLIGLSLVLFYSLLLSFSEQVGFISAYIIASSLIILLIVWYAKSVLQSTKFAILCGFSLTLTYGFILVLVNLETYALLFGSIGLLIVLTAIMSITRKLKLE